MNINEKVDTYLRQVNGLENIEFYSSKVELPVYLQSLYDISTAKILGVPVALVCLKTLAKTPNISEIKNQFKVIETALKVRPILVFENRAIKNLGTLSKNGVAYVYLGHEIYLPFLLTKISTAAQKQTTAINQKLSAWSQTILINQLLHENMTGQTLKTIADQHVAPPSTISRAINELKMLNLCTVEQIGTRKVLSFEQKKHLWKTSFQHLSTPIVTTAIISSWPDNYSKVTSGISALAKMTLLADTTFPTYAVERKKFNRDKLIPLSVDQQDSITIELWDRNPIATQIDNCADPISIYLSLLHTTDERVAMARDEYLRAYELEPIKLDELYD